MNYDYQLLDHRNIDWSGVRRTSYLVHQTLHYQYPGPIHDLRQRLVVIPADRHGGQRLLEHRLEVAAPDARVHSEIDAFGNRVYLLDVPRVDSAITFEVWLAVEQLCDGAPIVCKPEAPSVYLTSTRLTAPDESLRRAAAALKATGARDLDLACAIMDWVHGAMSYTHDVTNIHTTAAEALALGKGVCQDYAHIMLALCHLCGLPARYVSGHLLGEGGTHAWVEAIVPAERGASEAVAVALDPTHQRRAGHTYITVAVGQDYSDVAPTSGSYTAPYSGRLTTSKRAGLIALERDDGEAA